MKIERVNEDLGTYELGFGSMDIIPAIDLKNGKCVRLLQGRDDATTEYSSDPVAVAKRWTDSGATRLHVVNLDGAFGRASMNLEIVRRIAGEVGAHVQFGGGLRTTADIEAAINTGVKKIVLGTIAIEDRSAFTEILRRIGPDGVIVALDAFRGKITTKGWTKLTERPVLEAAREMEATGVQEILYTDISRDGMMTGSDLATLKELSEKTKLSIIASGGISSKDDVLDLVRLRARGITAVIIGKALYEGKIDLRQLLEEVRSC